MRVICEDCKKESDEKDMGADCRLAGESEHWSNHVCPYCGFWNDTDVVEAFALAGFSVADMYTLGRL
jgi:hypothetical protein